jgi:hypothetical protein
MVWKGAKTRRKPPKNVFSHSGWYGDGSAETFKRKETFLNGVDLELF